MSFVMLKINCSIISTIAIVFGTYIVHGASLKGAMDQAGNPSEDGYTTGTLAHEDNSTLNTTYIWPTQGETHTESTLSVDKTPNTDKRPLRAGLGPALKAKAGHLVELIQVAYDTYCGKVHRYLAFISAVHQQSTPGGRCKAFSDESKTSYGIPSTTTVTENNMASEEKLLDGMTQLRHTLKQTVIALTGSLKSTHQSCQSSSSNNPCDIICDQHREAEQEVVCTLQATILPNVEQYINLLEAETGNVSNIALVDILVESTVDQPNLRYHQVDVTQYAKDEMQVNRDFQGEYS